MNAGSKCGKCGGEMREGFILDMSHYNAPVIASWVAGKPEKGFLGRLNISDKAQFYIQSFRCVRWGYLESYAPDLDIPAA